MIKLQIKSIFGKVLFEYKKENNTIKETLEQAVKEKINLAYSNLRGSNLAYSNLAYSNLAYSNLAYSNLEGSNLEGSNLAYSNLAYSNLEGSNLRGSDLRGSNLANCKLDKRYIQVSCIGSSKRFTTYCFDDDIIWCGCFKGTLEEFESKCKITHINNEQYLKEYLGFINYVKSLK